MQGVWLHLGWGVVLHLFFISAEVSVMGIRYTSGIGVVVCAWHDELSFSDLSIVVP